MVKADGSPGFHKKLGENLDDLQKRVDGNKAALIIADGGVGEGKTTLMIHIADHFEGREISLEGEPAQYAIGGADFLKKLRLCYEKGHKAIIYDESGDFSKRGSLTRFNAMINRTFETFRAFKIIVILGLPSFAVLDNDLFDKNIPRLLLHCESRTQNIGYYRGYSLVRMMYVKHRMKKLVIKTQAFDKVSPNFYGHFWDVSPIRSKALDRLSTTGKKEILENAEVRIEGLVSYTDISKRLVRSVVWVRKAVSAKRLKHKRIIRQRKYFEEGVIDILADHISKVSDKKDKGERR